MQLISTENEIIYYKSQISYKKYYYSKKFFKL